MEIDSGLTRKEDVLEPNFFRILSSLTRFTNYKKVFYHEIQVRMYEPVSATIYF